MNRGGETAGQYGERGAGGKMKRPTSRKPAATPYARPPLAERGQRRWLSSLVDPAYRLIAGGATRLLPSFFSKLNSANALPAPNAQLHDAQQVETEQSAAGDEANFDNGVSNITDIAGPSKAVDVLTSGSDFNGDKKDDLSNETGLSEIEQLLKGKKFSRDEVNRLMGIINSRAVELPKEEEEKKKQTFTAAEKAKQPLITDDFTKKSSEEKQQDLSRAVLGFSTPLPQSAIRDDVGASPIEIAKAYMGRRTSEIDVSSKNTMSIDGRAVIPHSDEFSSKPYIPSPYSKPSPCWPGSMVQDKHDYSTPQTERSRFGLHNFPRTPYSRTIFSKSKSKLTELQSGSNESPRTSSTTLKQLQTPIYGQPRGDALDYGSAGPIRRVRRKGAAQVGVPTVHPQSSLIARTILEHIDRHPPTPKDKSEEFKRGIAWKKPLYSGDSSGTENGDDSLQTVVGFSSRKLVNQDYQKSSADESADKGKSLFKVPPPVENTVKATDVGSNGHAGVGRRPLVKRTNEVLNPFYVENTAKATDVVSNGPAGDGRRPLVKRTNEDFLKISPGAFGSAVSSQQKQHLSQSSATKHVFPSISVDKPHSKWTFSSSGNSSSSFTFPVSSSSTVFSEPRTPSIMPSLLASSQPKDRDDVPTYEFGSKKSAPLVFTFPSTSAEVQNDDDSDIKFSFGLSFALDGKDAVCY